MKLAKIKSFSALLVFLLVAILIASMIAFFTANKIIVAKPVGPNPAQAIWPSGTIWGTNLRFENTDNVLKTSISEIFWGVGDSDGVGPAPPDPPTGLIVELVDDIGNNYQAWVKAAVAEPASYTWSVQFRKVKNVDSNGGKVSSTMENSDTWFVPQDYSVVLENTDLGIHINLRAGSDNVTGANIRLTPILAALNVDNAVNIQSIENLDPLTGNPGGNLRLNVHVKNTGRYTDNYTVSAGGSIDPIIINLAPDSTDNVIVTTVYPSGTENIVITAAGTYATDQDYVTATGAQVKHDTTTSTQLSAGTITFGDGVIDNVTVAGSFGTPTGTVIFQVKFGAGSFTTYDNKNLVNGKATSVSYTPSSAGSYSFRAIYGGNDNYNGSQSSDNIEPLVVNKHGTTTVTLLSAGTITLGDNLTDNVTVSGLGSPLPTGIVTFQVKFDNAVSWTTYDNKSLVNGKATSALYAPSSAGSYWFRAIYGGDNNYENSQSSDNSEPLIVNKHGTTTVTLLSAGTITLGDNLTDNVTVAGLGSPLPTGIVTFQVKFDNGSWTTYDNKNLVNGKATSAPYIPSSAGSYWFRAIYGGDNNYENSQSSDNSEPLIVNKHGTTTVTLLSAGTITLGDNLTDNVTVAGLVSQLPTGVVTFQVKFDNGSWTTYDNKSLVNGKATSAPYTPSAAGQYWFRAIYGGDNNYENSSSLDNSEPLTVNIVGKHDTTTSTQLSASTITLGDNVTDNATVAGSFGTPTGSVLFQVKFGAGSFTTYDNKNLINGKATSVSYTPSSAGSYSFREIYGGDNNYNSSQSPDNSEPLIVNKHGTTTVTLLSAGTITLGDNVTDNVTVAGLASPLPTGTVIFQVKFDGGAWVTYDNESLVNGTAKSVLYTPSSAGDYWFRAIYGGDNNYNGSTSPDDGEPLTVNIVGKHDTTTSTQLSASTITFGDSVTDNVTVAGSFGTPTGTVVFQVMFDGGPWVTYDNENLINSGATSIPYVPSSAGNYWFRAIYGGNDNYNGSQSLDDSEPLTGNKFTIPENNVITELSESTITLGENITDTVTITGLGGQFPLPTGIVTFQVKFDDGVWGTYDIENLSGGTATSAEYVPLAAGSYWFRAIYSGDNNYTSSQSNDESEPLTVAMHDSTTTTKLSGSTIAIGENVTDTAMVTGLGNPLPMGMVGFQVKFDGGAWGTYDTENLSNGTATSIEYVPLVPGQYWFRAIYSGDNNYNGSQSGDESEPLTVNENENEPLFVNKAPSTTTTMLSENMIFPGDNVTDTVTVTGLPNPPYPLPTGTVIFQVKFDGGAWVTYDNESLVNGTATSVQLTLLVTGQYWFRAIYSGDNNYENSQSPDDNEPLTVGKHDSTTVTLLSSTTITLGENVTDKVTVTGSFGTPTGSVVFQVKFDGGAWVTFDIENLVNGMATSVEYVPLAAGDYWFRAIYSGDNNYNDSQSSDDSEPLMVTKHNTTTTTLLSASIITLGENVTDNAYVTTGLPNPPYPLPTGTTTFQVKFDNGSWVTFDIENLVNGMATSIEYVPLQAGQYYFRAIYSGDNNYNGSQSS